jgi:hypothetical protein
MILEEMEKLIQKIKKQPVESIYVYSCVSRRGFLQESARIETLPLQEIAPTSGFFTYGEFYHDENANQLLNGAMTTVVLSESENPAEHPEVHSSIQAQSLELNNSVSAIKDNVAYRNIGILKALSHLVNTVTGELGERTHELERVNDEIQYASMHDSLTGLYNRYFFEQEMKRMEAEENLSMAILVCDVDGLKFVNDTFGHNAGDMVLKTAADIL